VLAGEAAAGATAPLPKTMTEIGGRPLLWHLLMHYANCGFKDFVLAVGERTDAIKRYLVDLCTQNGNLKLDMKDGRIERESHARYDWQIDLVDAGTRSQLRQLLPYLSRGTCLLSRSDALSDIDLNLLLDFHRDHGRLATVLAVRPPARFGRLDLVGAEVVDFVEKPQSGEGWASGGVFVLEPDVFEYIDADDTQWESQLVEHLSEQGELMAYKHESFWQGVESLRERQLLENLWQSGKAPWKNWE
jgi:glucose-1-phosphate cytidylyltransferase